MRNWNNTIIIYCVIYQHLFFWNDLQLNLEKMCNWNMLLFQGNNKNITHASLKLLLETSDIRLSKDE